MHSRGCLMDDPYIDNTTERSMNEQTRKALELAKEALTRSSYYDPEPAIYAIRAALSAPAAPVAQWKPVAEVIWHDPTTDIFPPKPGKIIDASIAFMDSAPIGTKLYAAPAAPVAQPLTDAQILSAIRTIGLPQPRGLTRDVGPYEVTEPTYYLQLLVRAIERAHGIGQGGAA